MKKATTISRGAPFAYENKIIFAYGKFNFFEKFTLGHLAELLQHFCCQQVEIGAIHDKKIKVKQGTLEAYLREITGSDTSVASYIAAMLVKEGFAREINKHTIKFICCKDKKSSINKTR